MKILIGVVVVLVVLIGIVIGVGYLLPVRHRASRMATYPVSPDVLFAAITNVSAFPSWRSSVKTVDVVASAPKLSWRETGSDGTILYVADRVAAPTSLVTRIADPNLPFGGTWTYELAAMGKETTLRITEDGEVYNPLFRFMSRFVFGHTATIDTYLHDLGKRYAAASGISD
ncbi:MAG: SRPBCC family protein [bacterium]